MKHLPRTWEKLTRLRVVDPDGWRACQKSWNVPITEEEWKLLVSRSTILKQKEN